MGLEAGKGHPRAGGCEGLVLGLLCFLPLLPQGCPGCSGSRHTRSHNICAPPTHALPGHGVPPPHTSLARLPGASCAHKEGMELSAHLSAQHSLPACLGAAVRPVPAVGGNIKGVPPSPSPTTMLLLACAAGNASPANFPASEALPLCVIALLGSCLPLQVAACSACVLLASVILASSHSTGTGDGGSAARQSITSTAQLLPSAAWRRRCGTAAQLLHRHCPGHCMVMVQPQHSCVTLRPLHGH